MQPAGAARRPGVLGRLFRWLGGLLADLIYGLAWLFEAPRSELPGSRPEAAPEYTVPAPRIDAPAEPPAPVVPAAPATSAAPAVAAADPAEPARPGQEPDRAPGRLHHFVKFFLAKGVGAFIEQAIQFLVFAFAFHASYAVAGIGAGATFLTRLISQAAGKPLEKGAEQYLADKFQRSRGGVDRRLRRRHFVPTRAADLHPSMKRTPASAPARTPFVPPVTLDRAEPAASTPDHAL